MIIKQLSVFLEDKVGNLAEVTSILADNDINISAFSIADSVGYGILRLVVGRPELALQVLKQSGYSVHVTDVAGMIIPHQPGALNKALTILSDNKISIDYMYAFVSNTNEASVVIHTGNLSHLKEVLHANQLELLSTSDVYQI